MFSNAAKIRQIFCPCNNTLIHRCTPFKFFHNYTIHRNNRTKTPNCHYIGTHSYTFLFSLYVLMIIYKYSYNIPLRTILPEKEKKT